jgi:hypothetical protein
MFPRLNTERPMVLEKSEGSESLIGYLASNSGSFRIQVDLGTQHAWLCIVEKWMGSAPPINIVLVCSHQVLGTHSGLLILESAHRPGSMENVPLPPAEGSIAFEYVRVPSQAAFVGDDVLSSMEDSPVSYTAVIWLNPAATYDSGTDLPAHAYEVPPSAFERCTETTPPTLEVAPSHG